MSQGYELSWDSTIQKDEGGFVILPPGEYKFFVGAIDRQRHQGTVKVPPCPKAVVSVHIPYEDNDVIIPTNLYLHSSQEWKLSSFFRSVGLKKHGEPLVMDFPKSQGASGWCKVTNRKWKNQDGEDRLSNEVEFLDPPDTTTSEKKTFAPTDPAQSYQQPTTPQQATFQQQSFPGAGQPPEGFKPWS